MKTTTNPETERNKVAWVILGTDLGDRNKGPAVFAITRLSLAEGLGEACL